MKFVFDSTPLIHLVRAGLAWMIEELEGEKFTVPSVYAEVVEVGKARGFDDAPVTEKLISDGVIVVKKPSRELVTLVAISKDIHLGEAEVISLARELKGIAVIDDPVAREVADIHGIKKEGGYGIILRMLQDGKVTKNEAKEALQRFIASGWRCDAELYGKLIRAVDEFK